MCKKSFDRIVIFVLVLLSALFLLFLCIGLFNWITALPQPTIVEYVLFIVFEIEFISIIVCGLTLFFRWKDSLGYEKLIVIIAYVAFLSMGLATSFKFLIDIPNSDWISGFFLSISTGLITGLVIYFITNKRRQNEREIEDDVKILQVVRESYNEVCSFLYLELMSRDSGVEYENPFEKFPDLVNGFMTNIDNLFNSKLLHIMNPKHPMKGEDSEKQAVLNIITNFPNRVDYYIETYAKTGNSEEVKKLRDEFMQELTILEKFVDTKLDESQKASNRMKYSMF
jgi:hypothetical protein